VFTTGQGTTLEPLAAIDEAPAARRARRECSAFADGSAGWVQSWDLSVGVDGPGARLAVFLADCPGGCDDCGRDDRDSRDGVETSIEAIQRLVREHGTVVASSVRAFTTDTGVTTASAARGFTASGREPLQQPAFTRRILQAAQAASLHTALDTNGFLGERADDALLDAADLVLLDVRGGTDAGHGKVTGRSLRPTLDFARRLAQRGQATWMRYVLVPGHTDQVDEVEAFMGAVRGLDNVQRIDIVPFDEPGVLRCERFNPALSLRHLPRAIPELIDSVRARMAHAGLPVR
jgi:pyruvate formate lyase activating enzyme